MSSLRVFGSAWQSDLHAAHGVSRTSQRPFAVSRRKVCFTISSPYALSCLTSANVPDATSAIRLRAGRAFPAFAAILIPASVLSKKSARLSDTPRLTRTQSRCLNDSAEDENIYCEWCYEVQRLPSITSYPVRPGSRRRITCCCWFQCDNRIPNTQIHRRSMGRQSPILRLRSSTESRRWRRPGHT